jgi:proteic killer suppression protein
LSKQAKEAYEVQVEFRTKKLQKQYQQSKKAIRAYGERVAGRYVSRINIIKVAKDIEELKRMPVLHCHQLKGDRQGQWAITLIGRNRLVFTLQGEGLEIVRIEEVSKHYGD